MRPSSCLQLSPVDVSALKFSVTTCTPTVHPSAAIIQRCGRGAQSRCVTRWRFPRDDADSGGSCGRSNINPGDDEFFVRIQAIGISASEIPVVQQKRIKPDAGTLERLLQLLQIVRISRWKMKMANLDRSESLSRGDSRQLRSVSSCGCCCPPLYAYPFPHPIRSSEAAPAAGAGSRC